MTLGLALGWAGSVLALPAWVTQPPKQAGNVCAVGSASLEAGDAQALEAASEKARGEVLFQLRATVESSLKVSESASIIKKAGVETRENATDIRSEGGTKARAKDLAGLSVRERYLDSSSNSVYALACLDEAVAQEALQRQVVGLMEDWAAFQKEPGSFDGNAILLRLQRAGALEKRALLAEDTAELLSAAGLPRETQSALKQSTGEVMAGVARLRQANPIGARPMEGAGLEDVASAMRDAVTSSGLTWNDAAPKLLMTVVLNRAGQSRAIQGNWWTAQRTYQDLWVARAGLRVGFCDAQGRLFRSVDLQLKGLGFDDDAAARALLKELNLKLPGKIWELLRQSVNTDAMTKQEEN